jgi:hypothetical protein
VRGKDRRNWKKEHRQGELTDEDRKHRHRKYKEIRKKEIGS